MKVRTIAHTRCVYVSADCFPWPADAGCYAPSAGAAEGALPLGAAAGSGEPAVSRPPDMISSNDRTRVFGAAGLRA
eukprot:6241222-Prymnesium_polylepis.1